MQQVSTPGRTAAVDNIIRHFEKGTKTYSTFCDDVGMTESLEHRGISEE